MEVIYSCCRLDILEAVVENLYCLVHLSYLEEEYLNIHLDFGVMCLHTLYLHILFLQQLVF